MRASIKPARLEWTTEGAPYSPDFGDIYFSRDNGLAETEHTFVQGNDIPARFAALPAGESFTLIETGFGTGLNFLATLRHWQQRARPRARLDYIGIDAYPLSRGDLERALALWPELEDQAHLLLSHYPVLTPGFHCLQLTSQVRLILVLDDIESALQSLCGPAHSTLDSWRQCNADAWYLDGFAPRANPDMWQQQLFPLIRALSKPGTSLATFTAAGDVRRGLQAQGFSMAKVPGYGSKREMLRGVLSGDVPVQFPAQQNSPYRDRPLASWALSPTSEKPGRVAIIGAGIAGLTLAHRLAAESLEVVLLDQSEGPMLAASGNDQAALFTRLSPEQGELEDFGLTALAQAVHFYRQQPMAQAFYASGLAQLPRNSQEGEKMQRLATRLASAPELVHWLERDELRQQAGIDLPSGGLFFPSSGWIQPRQLAQAVLATGTIETRFNTQIRSLKQQSQRWQLLDAANRVVLEADSLVICSGHLSRQFAQLDWLPTRSIRGQVSLIRSPELTQLKTLLCGEGYLAPTLDGRHSLGATYHLDNAGSEVAETDHQKNLALLFGLTGMGDESVGQLEILEGRSGVRCTTPDYLPLCGPVPDTAELMNTHGALAKDARLQIFQPGPVLPGLFLNTGFGSRGFCYAPLCAEHLASRMLGRCSPLPWYLQVALHPARFPVRAMIRGKYKA